MTRIAESRTEALAVELLKVRGWENSRPPRGNVLWKQEYRDYSHLRDALAKGSKSGPGPGYPEFIVVDRQTFFPLLVGETKASAANVGQASAEAESYANAFLECGYNPLAIGIAGGDEAELTLGVSKHGLSGWKSVKYHKQPIQWIPTPDETRTLIDTPALFDLEPAVPPVAILADRADLINRILRECDVKDEFRPAVIGAFMLAVTVSGGQIRTNPQHVLADVNSECKKAFEGAEKFEIAKSILVPESNAKLAARGIEIINILRLLGVPVLARAHDYLGQLYETFFRYTGKNTIGQIFTPRHVTQFMVDMCDVSADDLVVDPTCGTGGFLIASLYKMIGTRHLQKREIKKLVAKHLMGFETEPITAALCVANMILRGDGTTAVVKDDCFTSDKYPEESATIVLGNPPFPHKATDDPPEKFINRGLEALKARGLLAMVIPMSLLVKNDKAPWRKEVLGKNSLRGVITLPSELFQPYAASTTAIVMLQRGTPHRTDTRTFFSHISNDGFRLKKNVRLPRDGGQLAQALKAFHSGQSIPGLCNFACLEGFRDGEEWAPGEYIETVSHSFDDLTTEIESLFRDYAAFHARYALQLRDFGDAISSQRVNPRPYGELTQRPAHGSSTPDSIGSMFDVYYGQRELHSKEHLIAGESLIISSKGTDNGCYGFFDFQDVITAPFVTVPSTGSIGEANVQTWPCGVTDDCLLLIPKDGTTAEDSWIAAATVRLERWRFNYGRKITPARIVNFRLRRDSQIHSFVNRWLTAAVRPVAQELVRSLSEGDAPLWNTASESRFRYLADTWKAETGHISKTSKKCTHPAYQEIIGMGDGVVQFIMRDLALSGGDWFWALTAITGQNPISDDDAGNIEKMKEAWIRWAKAKGYDVYAPSAKQSSQNSVQQITK